MVLLANLGERVFAPSEARPRLDVRVYVELRVRRRDLAEALNKIAQAKALLVLAGKLSASQFAREVQAESTRYKMPLTAAAHGAMGELLEKEGRYGKAASHYATAVELEPGDVGTLNNLGVIQVKMGRPKAAIKVLRKALEIDAKNVKAMINLALALDHAGEKEEAGALLDRAVELEPEYGLAWVNRGFFFVSRADWAAAEKCFRSALSNPVGLEPFAPSVGDLRLFLGYALAGLNRPEEVLEEVEKALRLNGDEAHCFLFKAWALGALGRNAEARDTLEKFHSHPRAKSILADKEAADVVEKLTTEIGGAEGSPVPAAGSGSNGKLRAALAAVVEEMKANPLPTTSPRYTRDELHERR